jgi:uncharacterized protein (DUF2147 family)
MIRAVLFFLLTACFLSGSWVANDISGIWVNNDKDAHIKIFSSYGKFYGQVVWMKCPNDSATGKPQLDKFNKDPKLKSRPVMNMIVLSDLEFDSENQEWNNGKIYNPKTGSYYDIFCTLKDKNTLEMHFYITLRSVGKLFYWNRLTQ